MICPHCKKEINHVDVRSQCYQRGTLEEKHGKFFITDCNRLDIIDTQAIECPKCNGPLMHVVGEGSPLEDDNTNVDLIASGYEWKCPACNENNTKTEIPKSQEVQCKRCNTEFTVNEINHAIDD